MRLEHITKLEARYLLWRTTSDPQHLRKARELLEHLVRHAPPEDQGEIRVRVPLHRLIREA